MESLECLEHRLFRNFARPLSLMRYPEFLDILRATSTFMFLRP